MYYTYVCPVPIRVQYERTYTIICLYTLTYVLYVRYNNMHIYWEDTYYMLSAMPYSKFYKAYDKAYYIYYKAYVMYWKDYYMYYKDYGLYHKAHNMHYKA